MADGFPPQDSHSSGESSPAEDLIQAFSNGLAARLSDAERNALQAAALQSMALALTLALHNAVAEQEHGRILRTALTTAAAKAILRGKKAEADEILKLAESRFVVPNLSAVIAEIKTYLETVSRQLQSPQAT
jgi:hypothetical protein